MSQWGLRKPFKISLWIMGAFIIIAIIVPRPDPNRESPKTASPTQPVVVPEAKPPVPPKPNRGKWDYSSSKSSFDDSPTEFITLAAENSISGWLKTATPSLVIRCAEKKTEVFLNVGMPPHVESDGATVRFRLDSDPAKTVMAGKSTDGEALFLPNAVTHAKALIQAERMVFSFVPFNASPVEATFHLAGLDEAVKPVRKACKW